MKPVILDTDIGMDIDDVWALVLLLKSPELDVKLITTCSGDTTYRAALVAKILTIAGRTDIPIGIGIPLEDSPRTHQKWLADFDLDTYGGEVIQDGVGAMVSAATSSEETVTIIAIGPLPNVAAALDRDPSIAAKAEFVGMHGSLKVGYLGMPKPAREYNVKCFPLACQRVFAEPWRKTITPLDTCGTIVLSGERFASVMASDDPLIKSAVDCHLAWYEAVKEWPLLKELNPRESTSVLYDSVAIYLAIGEEWLEVEDHDITVTDDGKTLMGEVEGALTSSGAAMRCAMRWRDVDAFLDFLANRLT